MRNASPKSSETRPNPWDTAARQARYLDCRPWEGAASRARHLDTRSWDLATARARRLDRRVPATPAEGRR